MIKYYHLKVCLIILLFVNVLTSLSGQKLGVSMPLRSKTISSNDSIVRFKINSKKVNVKLEDRTFYYWYFNNQIKHTVSGIGGDLLEDLYTSYDSDGNLIEQGKFKNGKKVGVWKRWYFDGNMNSIVQWKNGQKNGFEKLYGMEGQLVMVGNYNNGYKSGWFKEFSNKGELIKTTRFKKGQKNGTELVRMNNGKVLKFRYKNCVEIKKNKDSSAKKQKPHEKSLNSKNQKDTKADRKSIKKKEPKSKKYMQDDKENKGGSNKSKLDIRPFLKRTFSKKE